MNMRLRSIEIKETKDCRNKSIRQASRRTTGGGNRIAPYLFNGLFAAPWRKRAVIVLCIAKVHSGRFLVLSTCKSISARMILDKGCTILINLLHGGIFSRLTQYLPYWFQELHWEDFFLVLVSILRAAPLDGDPLAFASLLSFWRARVLSLEFW